MKTDIWHYVPLSDFAAPQATMTQSIKGGFKGLWQMLWDSRNLPDDSQKSDVSLQQIPHELLERLVPGPDWQMPARVLKNVLEELFKTAPRENPCFMVIGLPQAGNAEILTALAGELKWNLVQPPGNEQILSQDHNWLKQMVQQETPWVIPALERCYLRHTHGLALVRQLFEKINSGTLGSGIIGCDSWALGYLKHVLPGRLPGAVVMQALDDNALSQWFQQMASTGIEKPFRFCQADNGQPIFPSDPDPEPTARPEVKTSLFLNHLAVHSLGIPGVALCLWRQALKMEPDKAMSDKALMDNPAPGKAPAPEDRTLWVLPWNKLDHPVLASHISPESAILLHSLLIHNGLSQDILQEILPFSSHIITRRALALRDAGLIEENNGVWNVSSAGYPLIRSYLRGEGYLTDKF